MLDTATRANDWKRALQRASARGLAVEAIGIDHLEGGVEELYFKASSWSRPDSIGHGVRIVTAPAGVFVECSCEGACKGYPCMHAAAALRTVGLLPDAMLIDADNTPTAA